jgi:hypothetical protein
MKLLPFLPFNDSPAHTSEAINTDVGWFTYYVWYEANYTINVWFKLIEANC